MGDGTEQNPYTREDIIRLIKQNGKTAEGLNLSDKVFESGIDLRGLDLRGIILERAVFSRSPLFGHDNLPAELGNIEDSLSSIKDVHLEGVTLEGANLKEANLGGAHLEGADLTEARLEGAILTGSHLDGAHLIGANLEGTDLECTNLEGANLYSANLDGAYLVLTRFSRDTNFTSVRWGNYILACELGGEFENATDTYRELKMWHTEHGLYDTAAKFYYREREASRKGARHWNDRAAGWLSWAVFGHGERWERLLFWVAGFILLFALIYFAFDETRQWQYFGDYIYFSTVSFTALGYGSWLQVTNNWIKGIGAFESFIGVFSMALLLVTFVRKWTR